MDTNIEKFSSQASSDVLAEMRKIALGDGRHLRIVLEEAMRDYIAKRKSSRPRNHVIGALQDSIKEFNNLYQKLAK